MGSGDTLIILEDELPVGVDFIARAMPDLRDGNVNRASRRSIGPNHSLKGCGWLS